MVTIYDRHGELKDEIILQGQCSGMAWDKDGDTLAVINDKNGTECLIFSMISPKIDFWTLRSFLVLRLHLAPFAIPRLDQRQCSEFLSPICFNMGICISKVQL